MRSKTTNATAITALFGAAALSQSALAATIKSPPSLVVCQPISIDWAEAPDGDVFLSVIPGGDLSSPALVDLGKQSGSSGKIVWTVNLKADTEITFKLVDSAGGAAYSSPIKIQSGSDVSCIDKEAVVSTGGSTSASSSSGSASSSASSSSVSSETGTAASTGALNSTSSAPFTGTSTSTDTMATSTGVTDSIASSVSSILSSEVPFNTTIPGAGFNTFQMSGVTLGIAGLAAVLVASA